MGTCNFPSCFFNIYVTRVSVIYFVFFFFCIWRFYVCVFLGLAQYSGDPRIEWHLNAYSTKDAVIDAVRNLPYKGGNTLTGEERDSLTHFTVSPTFSCSYSSTFLPFARIIFSSLRFSRTCFKLYSGELFQAWIWLTGGVTQDWDPHHRWEVSGWCHTTSWKTAKCWHWAVCYW